MNRRPFDTFFRAAAIAQCFPFQERFAQELPALADVPTGLGKTAMVVVGWLWRLFEAGDGIRHQTPRRLVYCLPMRVLVEQTQDNTIRWLHNLGRLGGDVTFDPLLSSGERATPNHRVATYAPNASEPGKVAVYVLMGGEDEDDWDIHPEREAIIIGTQDMLLSRALNRGYAASRSRWPMQFGLLHTDCLWVFDEIQLMGSGLATTAQLEAFRRLLPRKDAETAANSHGCRSVWMSATMQADWLKTVDFRDRVDGLPRLELDAEDRKNDEVTKRWNARKPLEKAKATTGEAEALAGEIRQAHKPGTRTIVVVNTVSRARALFESLGNAASDGRTAVTKKKGRSGKGTPAPAPDASKPAPSLVLLHSRFRPPDRAKRVADALADVTADSPGTIVVSTQVIEAGVDVSATTLFTELAPWASLVQRFGRCNRRGEQNEHACVRWIDLPAKNTEAEKLRFPYELADLRAAADQLAKLNDVGLGSLAAHREELSEEAQAVLFPHEHTHVVRKRDLIDLFDTTPDLAGNDIDIDRFVREVEGSDVRVFWRAWDHPKGHEPPPTDEPAPRREELCPAPIGEFRDFAKKRGAPVWRWDFLGEKWERPDSAKIAPGQVFLVHADAGGYAPESGWDAKSTVRVELVPPELTGPNDTPDATGEDAPSQIGVWQSIDEHTNEVCSELDTIVRALPLDGAQLAVLRTAARWHDRGKAHAVFQNAIDDGQAVQRHRGAVTRRARPNNRIGNRVIAKAPGKRWNNGQFADAGWWRRYDWPDGGRRHFRHELASALAVLQRNHADLSQNRLNEKDLNLVAYLIAAHHGKVRLSIRSLPNEMRPRDRDGKHLNGCRFARGVWDDDVLRSVDLGGGITAPAVTLSLEPMELGLGEGKPVEYFKDKPSWAERMIGLRDALGPFRLAYLEAILRAADMRASANAANLGTAQ